MKLYHFRSGGRSALTDDKTGSKLPVDGGTWTYFKEHNIDEKDGPRIGANSKDIIDGVTANGFFVWPQE